MRALVIGAALLLAPALASAQTLDPAAPPSHVQFRMLHPFIEDDEGVSVLSGAYYLDGRMLLNDRVLLFAELPFAYVSVDTELLGDESSSSIGNPLLGIGVLTEDIELRFATRVPITPDDEFANVYALLADFHNFEAFFPDVWSIEAGARVERFLNPNVAGAVDLATVLLVPTEDGETEAVLDYLFSAGYVGTMARVAALFDGRFALTGDGDFGERTVHTLGFSADVGRGRLRPGLHLRLPLDDELEEVDMVLGLSLQYFFGQ